MADYLSVPMARFVLQHTHTDTDRHTWISELFIRKLRHWVRKRMIRVGRVCCYCCNSATVATSNTSDAVSNGGSEWAELLDKGGTRNGPNHDREVNFVKAWFNQNVMTKSRCGHDLSEYIYDIVYCIVHVWAYWLIIFYFQVSDAHRLIGIKCVYRFRRHICRCRTHSQSHRGEMIKSFDEMSHVGDTASSLKVTNYVSVNTNSFLHDSASNRWLSVLFQSQFQITLNRQWWYGNIWIN